MSEKKEFVANSLKDALQRAAEEFQVDATRVKYRIVTEKTKYFGHKQREIYIEAWPMDSSEFDGMERFVRDLIAALKVDLSFEMERHPDFVRITFSGEDYRMVLYQNGNLLNAIQYLLNRLFSDAVGKKIYCECQNYRRKKEVELTSLAHRLAKQVKRSGKPVNLPQLNPFERRIVHMTINKYADLESKSEGDNFLKVITVRKKSNE